MVLVEWLHQGSIACQLTILPGGPFWTSPPAYLDPGTGSLIIQMLIGTLVGGAVAARLFWKRGARRLKRMFSSRSSHDEVDS